MFAPNLVWRNEPLKLRVAKHIDLPIVVENDANCHAWAETRFGAARGMTTVVAVILGTGIGGGIVLDGHLYRGGFGLAGEPGHVRVVPDGRLCGCGNRGCWEQYASGNALVREARDMADSSPSSMPFLMAAVAGDVDAITGPLVTEAAHAGDEGARRCFETIGRWVGQGLADLATILDPACFVVGGGPSDAGAVLIDPVREAFAAALSGGSLPAARADPRGRTRKRRRSGRRGRPGPHPLRAPAPRRPPRALRTVGNLLSLQRREVSEGSGSSAPSLGGPLQRSGDEDAPRCWPSSARSVATLA